MSPGHGPRHSCAPRTALTGPLVVAFADTLFKADFTLDSSVPGTIWVQKVDDPKPFGVVKLNDRARLPTSWRSPKEFVSDLAIIGIYYFQDGEYLRERACNTCSTTTSRTRASTSSPTPSKT